MAAGLAIIADVELHRQFDEPRCLDADLGHRLGMSRPTNIRQTIEGNLPEIEAFGHVAREECNVAMPRGGFKKGYVYYLSEEQALCTATLSRAPNAPAVRAMLIRVWSACRKGLLAPARVAIDVRDPSQLAIIAAQLIEVNREATERAVRAESTLAIAAPKAAALDRIADTTGLILPSDAAKAMGLRPKDLAEHMLDGHRWLFRRAGSGRLAGRQDKLNARLLAERTVPVGENRTEIQVYITPKGLTRLAQELGVVVAQAPDLFDHTQNYRPISHHDASAPVDRARTT